MKGSTVIKEVDYLRISLNFSCNLFCKYCRAGETKERGGALLSAEEILKVVKACVPLGINRFRLTGGEPLLRTDLIEIAGGILQVEGVRDLSLTTNGTCLCQYARALKEAGLKRLNVSLDTLSKEKFLALAGKDLLDDILAGIKEAKDIGFSPLRVNVVVMRNVNLNELLDFVDFSSNFDIQVRFIELMPRSYSDVFFKENFVPISEVKEILNKKFTLSNVSQGGSGPAHYYKVKGKGIIGIIAPASGGFCDSCNRLRLTPYGRLKLCLFNKKEIDIKPVLKKNNLESLTKLFEEAVLLKPKGRKESVICGTMSEIGG